MQQDLDFGSLFFLWPVLVAANGMQNPSHVAVPLATFFSHGNLTHPLSLEGNTRIR